MGKKDRPLEDFRKFIGLGDRLIPRPKRNRQPGSKYYRKQLGRIIKQGLRK